MATFGQEWRPWSEWFKAQADPGRHCLHMAVFAAHTFMSKRKVEGYLWHQSKVRINIDSVHESQINHRQRTSTLCLGFIRVYIVCIVECNDTAASEIIIICLYQFISIRTWRLLSSKHVYMLGLRAFQGHVCCLRYIHRTIRVLLLFSKCVDPPYHQCSLILCSLCIAETKP